MKFVHLSQIESKIARLVVNRPEVRNALHWEAMAEFSEAITTLKQEPDIRVLLVEGTGKAFISGADLGLVASLDGPEDGERLSKTMGDVLEEMQHLPLITIALINGPARGGGAEIAVSCDLRLMSKEATIGFVQTGLGLIPGWGGGHRLFGLVGYAKALEYLASARIITAEEALRDGLVNGTFSKGELDAQALALARQISGNDLQAVRSVKEMLRGWEQDQANSRLLEERRRFVELWDRQERRDIFNKITNK